MKAFILKSLIVSGALFCIILYTATFAITEEEKHSDPFRSCVSSECHSPITEHKYLHGPLKVGQCTVCHAPLPGSDHKFGILKSEEDMCTTCHRPVDTETFLHEPVAEGSCMECHDPHGSASRSQIRISPVARLCNDCHDPVATGSHAHDPVAKGDCLVCHHAHGSMAEKLLDVSGNRLCFECHDERNPASNGVQDMHLVEKDCADCHRTHDSEYAKRLDRPPLDLCFECHEELQEIINLSQYRHKATTEEQTCVECHKAHGSRQLTRLRKPSGDLCFECHEDLKGKIDAAEFKHRPVADNACGSCHLPHSSEYTNLHLALFPGGRYTDYHTESYALCFTCHEEAITDEPHTETLTEFRNGKLNLHYLHVHKEDHGRTCLACHNWHAGSLPRLIREEAPYGTWMVPMRFEVTETGGSCSPGCHEKYSYDRVNPLQLKTE